MTDTKRKSYARHREARLARARGYYQETKDDPAVKAKRRALAKAHRERRRRFLQTVRHTAGCIDCGTTEGVLDFDHRRGEEKLFSPAYCCTSLTRLIAEIMKCDVRCHSCHTTRHMNERWALR